jgi:archaellum biogenesis protein FlaJ (TadC family)
MKSLAFVVALALLAIGVAGLVVPSSLAWVGRHSVTPAAFYLIAAVRIIFGVALVFAAPASRMPRTIRVLGYVIVIAGLATALVGLVAMDRAREIIESVLQHGSGFVRMVGVLVAAFGGFIAYACGPETASRTSGKKGGVR